MLYRDPPICAPLSCSRAPQVPRARGQRAHRGDGVRGPGSGARGRQPRAHELLRVRAEALGNGQGSHPQTTVKKAAALSERFPSIERHLFDHFSGMSLHAAL